MNHSPKAFGVAALAFSLSACSMHSVKREAFGPKKTYAVVSIYGQHKITSQGNNQGMGTLSSLVKSAKKSAGFSNDVSLVLDEGADILVRNLGANKNFRLLPAAQVLAHPAYAKAAADESKGLVLKFKPAKGYKYFSMRNKEKLSRLAKSLGVDGVIVAQMDYGYAFSGVAAAGLIAAGKHRAVVNLALVAYDRNAQIVWSDMIRKTSDKGVGTAAATSADFAKLRPHLIETAEVSSKALLVGLNQSVAAR